jgi:hypothetical protein
MVSAKVTDWVVEMGGSLEVR